MDLKSLFGNYKMARCSIKLEPLPLLIYFGAEGAVIRYTHTCNRYR
jgi:hypothetical protein